MSNACIPVTDADEFKLICALAVIIANLFMKIKPQYNYSTSLLFSSSRYI